MLRLLFLSVCIINLTTSYLSNIIPTSRIVRRNLEKTDSSDGTIIRYINNEDDFADVYRFIFQNFHEEETNNKEKVISSIKLECQYQLTTGVTTFVRADDSNGNIVGYGEIRLSSKGENDIESSDGGDGVACCMESSYGSGGSGDRVASEEGDYYTAFGTMSPTPTNARNSAVGDDRNTQGGVTNSGTSSRSVNGVIEWIRSSVIICVLLLL